MTHVDVDSILPSAPKLAGGAHAAATPGVSGPALALGNLIGNLIVGQMNASQQRDAARRTTSLKAVLTRAAPAAKLHDSLKTSLSAAGFTELRHEPDADAFAMEQPGLLKRIEEPHILTVHANYGWTGRGPDTPWMKTRVRLWEKGRHRPILCRDYTYLGNALSGGEDESWQAAVEQFLTESAGEVSAMAELDARVPSSDAAPPVLLKAHIPALDEEPAVADKPFVSVAERPARWLARSDAGGEGRLWSLPKEGVHVREAPMKTGP